MKIKLRMFTKNRHSRNINPVNTAAITVGSSELHRYVVIFEKNGEYNYFFETSIANNWGLHSYLLLKLQLEFSHGPVFISELLRGEISSQKFPDCPLKY